MYGHLLQTGPAFRVFNHGSFFDPASSVSDP
jgi:hypothetical protein